MGLLVSEVLFDQELTMSVITGSTGYQMCK